MDATILALTNKISEVLHLATVEYRRLRDVDKQVKNLRVELELLTAWIPMVEGRSGRDKLAEVWVNLIRKAVFDAEDIIEEYRHEVVRAHPGFETDARRQRRPCCCLTFPFMEVPARYSLSKRIDDVLRQLERVKKKNPFHAPDGADDSSILHPGIHFGRIHGVPWSFQSITGSSSQDSRFDYIAHDACGYTDLITRLLLDDNSMPQAVVFITGESGIGKTTVARQIFLARAVRKHFDICSWVCQPPKSRSGDYLDQICQQMQEQTHFHDCSSTAHAKKVLARMKFLVILDGMDDIGDLKSVLGELPDASGGSRILVTTTVGEDKIASTIRNIKKTVRMKRLGRPDCLALFRQWVPRSDRYRIYDDRIHEISQGLPLAIRWLAGLLYCKDHKRQWDEVFNLLESYGTLGLIKQILTVNYVTMPIVVKLCFLYLAAMPQNTQHDYDKLIRLWCAEGIFESVAKNVREEVEAAERCYSVLVLRGLILSRSDQTGAIIYSVHGSVLKFATSMASKSSFLECCSQLDIRDASVVRRLSVQNHVDRKVNIRSCFPNLRTLLGHFVEDRAEQVDNMSDMSQRQATATTVQASSSRPLKQSRLDFLGHSKYLRVLDLQGLRLGILPQSIGDMIYLRYLGLRCCGLKDLPTSVAKLRNLETLDVTQNEVKTIADEFWTNENLKHVLAQNLSLPGSMGSLRELMTLHGVIPSSLWTQHNCPLHEMNGLLSLEMLGVTDTVVQLMAMAVAQDIHYSYLHHLKLKGACIHPSILSCRLHKLQSLELDGNFMLENFNTNWDSRSFLLCRSPERLVLKSSWISQKYITIFFSETSLISQLELLDNCFSGEELSFISCELPNLEKLKIGNMEALKKVVVEGSAMPILKILEIFGCPNMKSIQGLKSLKDLHDVVLYKMPEVVAQIETEDKELYDRIKHVRAIA